MLPIFNLLVSLVVLKMRTRWLQSTKKTEAAGPSYSKYVEQGHCNGVIVGFTLGMSILDFPGTRNFGLDLLKFFSWTTG
ncbi:hypothetical protein G7047_25275 [Diaphorobacter sp. HDW4A]|uniref:hypothetical protein n=1 Tax=Diaphorobacter sp. HDW4A TaxID=2714924 RepID=UPI00140A2726|nr:hypothetical protein [Diaphorobacter sp. HDW4A]QIL82882.1 hypothetical protein G7047_25275 [Diaphorobacter sp. HDW4A]